jgi:hypothetical protein
MLSEHQEQVLLIEWCDTHPDDRLKLIFAIPNGIRTTMGAAIKAKREGLRRGVPDLFLPISTDCYNGLFIEMKRAKNGALSKDQEKWRVKLKAQGYMWVCCEGANQAKLAISEYLS